MQSGLRKFAQHKNTPSDAKLAGRLRKSVSIVEALLWNRLRELSDRHDIRFRRQHPIHPFVVDFACLAARLAIELDGMSHDSTWKKDRERQNFIEEQGFRVIRFANAEVMGDVDAVASAIILEAQKLRRARWSGRK